MKKDKHIGKIYVTPAGFTLCVAEWKNRDSIVVEVVETGERIKTDYWALEHGEVVPNLYRFPPKGECSIKQAITLTIGIVTLIAGGLACLITYLVSL